MVNLSGTSGFDTLIRAQDLLERSALNVAKNGPSPSETTNLIRAKEQFSAGTKLIKAEDEQTQKLLDMLG